MSNQYPMDFDSINKGDVIDRARIERMFGINASKNPIAYRRKMMELGNEIERRCVVRGLLYRCDGDNIRIMTDSEGDLRTWKRIRDGARTMTRNTKRRAVIDRSGFTPAEQAIAEHRDRVATAVVLTNAKQLRRAEHEAKILAADAEAKKK